MRDTTHVTYLHARLRILKLTPPGGARFSSTLCHDARLPTLLMSTSHARHPDVPASRASRLLPPDIVPLVLAHLSWRVRDLGACCLVNTLWRRYATPFLYERIESRTLCRSCVMASFSTCVPMGHSSMSITRPVVALSNPIGTDTDLSTGRSVSCVRRSTAGRSK